MFSEQSCVCQGGTINLKMSAFFVFWDILRNIFFYGYCCCRIVQLQYMVPKRYLKLVLYLKLYSAVLFTHTNISLRLSEPVPKQWEWTGLSLHTACVRLSWIYWRDPWALVSAGKICSCCFCKYWLCISSNPPEMPHHIPRFSHPCLSCHLSTQGALVKSDSAFAAQMQFCFGPTLLSNMLTSMYGLMTLFTVGFTFCFKCQLIYFSFLTIHCLAVCVGWLVVRIVLCFDKVWRV